jgi:hypothetical protein
MTSLLGSLTCPSSRRLQHPLAAHGVSHDKQARQQSQRFTEEYCFLAGGYTTNDELNNLYVRIGLVGCCGSCRRDGQRRCQGECAHNVHVNARAAMHECIPAGYKSNPRLKPADLQSAPTRGQHFQSINGFRTSTGLATRARQLVIEKLTAKRSQALREPTCPLGAFLFGCGTSERSMYKRRARSPGRWRSTRARAPQCGALTPIMLPPSAINRTRSSA